MRPAFVRVFSSFILMMLALSPIAVTRVGASMQGLGDLGLPELDVTVTDTTISGIPGSLEANRYLIHVTAQSEGPSGVEFARPAEGTAEEFLDALSDLHAGHAHNESMDMPADDHADDEDAHDDGEEMHEASPEADHSMAGDDHEDSMEMADELSPAYKATFAGGVLAQGGQTADVVVDLGPGEWVVTGGADATQEPVILTVTGEMPADLPQPEADAKMILGEYVIEVIEGQLDVPGPLVVEVQNIGVQPHLVDFSRSDVALGEDDIAAAIAAVEAGGTPSASDFNPNRDLHLVMATTTQSSGTTMWVTIDLEPGSYVLLCHFPDMGDGRTHSAHGMVRVMEIGG